ncbi:uncharacterized protein LOC111648204 [Seriola lalandi dorsalis]|uniref:uncharacterized protein LOC111648204 n=1 Tax=Seriola lalandi dorsalis TaxID=1841481 RepID=UPI000C6FA4CD|nr:uncharacterized protein LOC111648204 [Seriola lalandi dorsalis]
MILLWATLFLLHQGHTMVPVITVQPGEPATFLCVLPREDLNKRQVLWYKQSAGDSLKIIVTQRKSINPVYGPAFSASRLEVKQSKNIMKLTILKTAHEDEGMYHCAVIDWTENTWTGTYLSVKGNPQRTSNYTVVQWPTVSDPVHPGDSVTLQCSVLFESVNKTCPGDHSVYWFRAGSDKSHPDIIYNDGNKLDKCDNRSDSLKSCVYRFTKNINSYDAGTYYCAVATCGEIIFGDGTKLCLSNTGASSEFIALVISVVCLAISVIGNIVFICCRTPRPVSEQFKGRESASPEGRHDNLSQPVHENTEDGLDLNYAALYFSGGKVTRGRKKKELKTEESVYSHVEKQM